LLWLYGSWIYNYLCNQCLSPLTLWFQIPLRQGVLNTTLCDKVCQWLAIGRWFSLISSTNKTDCCDITVILLKVALNTITLKSVAIIWRYNYVYQKRNLTFCFLIGNQIITYIQFSFITYIQFSFKTDQCFLRIRFFNNFTIVQTMLPGSSHFGFLTTNLAKGP
jgi:hypothetical protein